MTAVNAPPQWQQWGEWAWLGVVVVGLGLELYAAFINSHTPTFTGMVKKFCPYPIIRAGFLGALFYHFVIQPIYEALKAMGVKVF